MAGMWPKIWTEGSQTKAGGGRWGSTGRGDSLGKDDGVCVACSGCLREFSMNSLSSRWGGRDQPGEVKKQCPVNPEKECELHPLKDFKKQRDNFMSVFLKVHSAHDATTAHKLKWMDYIGATRSTSSKLNADGKRTHFEGTSTVQRCDTLTISKNKCKGLKHIKYIKNPWIWNDNIITGHF